MLNQIIACIITLLEGIMIGVCNVIPGVSGGTLVVVFNIFDQFMDITGLKIKKIIKNWKFTVPLLLGMLSGIVLFSKAITFLVTNFEIQTYYFFTGLIIGSIPLLFSLAYKNKDKEFFSIKKNIGLIISTVIGIVLILCFTILQNKFGNPKDIVNAELPDINFPLLAKLFIAGVFGAVAMIVPGISGALLMLIMGVYPVVIAAIPALLNPKTMVHAFFLLVPNGIGVLTGLVAGSNLFKFLMRKFPNYTYAVILGLILGSFVNVFPGFKSFTNGGRQIIGCIFCLLAGTALAYFSTKLQPGDSAQNQELELPETDSDDVRDSEGLEE